VIRTIVYAALWCCSVAAGAGSPAGDVHSFQIDSRIYGHPRKVWVYTPPGYDAKGSSPYGLVVAFDGADYIDTIPLPKFLDSLAAARKMPPMVAVLIENGSGAVRLADLANQPVFASFLADEVVPWVRQHYNVTRDPHRTIVTGSSAGGLAAAYVALLHPEIFGNVLAQSPALWRGYASSNAAPYEWLTAQYAAQPRRDVRFFVDVGSRETTHAVGVGPVFIEAVRRFRDVLREKGYSVIYTEVPGGVHAPQTWVKRLPIGLQALAGS
jgi:enterochelin esterase family protein